MASCLAHDPEVRIHLKVGKRERVLTFCAIDHQEILDHPWLQRSKEKVANEEQKQDLGEKGGSCFKCCAPKNVSSDYCHFNPELLLQALQEDFV